MICRAGLAHFPALPTYSPTTATTTIAKSDNDGETITITRGNHPVAEIGPARRRTGADLRTALAEIAPPDDSFAENIADALALVTPEERDPWADA